MDRTDYDIEDYSAEQEYTVTITYKVDLIADRSGEYDDATQRHDAEIAQAMRLLGVKKYDVDYEC